MLNTKLLETLYDQFIIDICDHLGGAILPLKKEGEYSSGKGKGNSKAPPKEEFKKMFITMTNFKLGEHYGVHHSTISKWGCMYGLKKPVWKKHAVPEKKELEFLCLKHTIREIAGHYSVSLPTASGWINEYDLKTIGSRKKVSANKQTKTTRVTIDSADIGSYQLMN